MISRRKKLFYHRVQRSGAGGKIIYLPKEFCDQHSIEPQDMIQITDNRDGTLVIEKAGRLQSQT